MGKTKGARSLTTLLMINKDGISLQVKPAADGSGRERTVATLKHFPRAFPARLPPMHPNFGRAFQELRSLQPGGGLQNSGPARTAAAAAASPPRARRAGTLPRRRADHSPASCPGALTCSRAPSTHGEARPQEPVPGSGSAPRTQHARAPHAPRLRAHTHTPPLPPRCASRPVEPRPGRTSP